MSTTNLPDMESLIDEFQLRQIGNSRGKQGNPPHTQPDLDQVEQQVANKCEKLYEGLVRHYEADTKAQEDRMRAPALPTVVWIEESINDMKATMSRNHDDMENQREEAQKAIDKLNKFLKRHELVGQEPELPEKPMKMLFLIFAVLLVETAINGFFFGQNLDTGLFGGLGEAALISAINVLAFGGLGALALQFGHHVRQPPRIAAGIGAVLLLAMVVVWNLGVAHYREALLPDYPPPPAEIGVASEEEVALAQCYRGEDPSDGDAEALCLLTTRWFELDGFRSWALMIIGIAAWGFAVREFLQKDGTYPGYARLARRAWKKNDKRMTMRTEVIDELETTRQRAERTELNHFAEVDPEFAWNQGQEAYRQSLALHNTLCVQVDNLAKSGRAAIEVYRSANRDAPRPRPQPEPQGWLPEPEYWKQPWTPEWELPDPPVKPDLGTLEEASARKAELKIRHEERTEDLNQAFQAHLAKVDQVMSVHGV